MRDAYAQLASVDDAIWNDDEVDSDDEREVGNSANVVVEMPDPVVTVDPVQVQLDIDEVLTAKMAKVCSFELPCALSFKCRIANQPVRFDATDAQTPLKGRFAVLKQKMIAYKSVDRLKIGKVWKKGSGERYGGLLWVFVREKRKPWRAHVRSCRVWD